MADRRRPGSDSPPRKVSRPKAPRGGPSDSPTPPSRGRARFRERLRQDRFLFTMCLLFLAFTTWAFAVSWRLFGDPLLLALAILSVPPAFYLFYLRDSSAA